MQVSRDLRASGEPNVSPVIGTDGKTYAATRPAPEPNTWVEPQGDDYEDQAFSAFTEKGPNIRRDAT